MTTNADVSFSAAERAALCVTATEMGPDAPTLCQGWTVRDVLAHLIVREGRPDTLPGLRLGPFSGWTERVRREKAEAPFPELVREVRDGPPRLSPFAIPGVDRQFNASEHFVHHEDIRRCDGAGDWAPRAFDAATTATLATLVSGTARLMLRGFPAGLSLVTPDGDRLVSRPGESAVEILGEPGELLLWVFGRSAVKVTVTGDPAGVAALATVSRKA